MKRMLWLAAGILLSGLVAGQGMANETAGKSASPTAAPGTPQAGAGKRVSAVSQIQQDIVNKREMDRRRKNEMMKVRDKTIIAEAKMTKVEKAKLKVQPAAH
ncbi:MAG: hypothetical protein HGA96_04135 [Desulfobulbaceae bacterium]|nr:hypothetical protein [Desulfobulbaceae bacterium]